MIKKLEENNEGKQPATENTQAKPAKDSNEKEKEDYEDYSFTQVDSPKISNVDPMSELYIQLKSLWDFSNTSSLLMQVKQSPESKAASAKKSRGSYVDLTNELSLNLSNYESTRLNESSESNVTSAEKKRKHYINHTREFLLYQPQELEQQLLSLSLSEYLKTPAKEAGCLDTNQQNSDRKKYCENQLEMSTESISDQMNEASTLSSSMMESDVAEEFQTKKKRRKRRYCGKQEVSIYQPPEPEQSLPLNCMSCNSHLHRLDESITSEDNVSSEESLFNYILNDTNKKPHKQSGEVGRWSESSLQKSSATEGNDSTVLPREPEETSVWMLQKEDSKKSISKIIVEGGKYGIQSFVETNHLAIKFKHLSEFFYHYDVKFSSDDRSLNRKLLDEFIKKYCSDRNPAFDGVNNLYSATELFPHESKQGEIVLELRNNPHEFTVTVTLVQMISTEPLRNLLSNSTPADPIPQTISQCLNVILGYALHSLGYKSRDDVYISNDANSHSLGIGMEMKLGLVQSVVFGTKPFLNVYAEQKVFPAEQNVITTISEVCNLYNDALNSQLRDEAKKTRLEGFLKNLKVEYKNVAYFVTKLGPSPNRLLYNQNGTTITLERYFQDTNQLLAYPHMPSLLVNDAPRNYRDTPLLLPPEFCKITGGNLSENFQKEVSAQLIDLSGSPRDRKRNIVDLFPHAQINQNACVQEFGISLVNTFEIINSRILTPPMIVYDNNMTRPTCTGQWHLKGLYTDAGVESPILWAIINLAEHRSNNQFNRFKKVMHDGCKVAGLTIKDNEDALVKVIQGDIVNLEGMAKYNFVFVIIPNDNNIYGNIKTIAEKSVGCLIQCIKLKTFDQISSFENNALIENIAQKINAKLNGINHVLEAGQLGIKWPFMVMGAEVAHPTSETGGSSIAVITASYDKNAFQYNIYYRSQDAKMKTIHDLKEMTRRQLRHFQIKNQNKLPSTIMFYRGGVSDEQFCLTCSVEIKAIKSACKTFQSDYNPKVTFLIVQRRHHTRFFPLDANQIGSSAKQQNRHKCNSPPRSDNIPVGTCVDTIITHPSMLTFYLLSHHISNLKLACPSKYVLLYDDNNFDIDFLENLTFRLCHLFSRCTKSVSHPAPTYYAHLAAERVKAYNEGDEIQQNELDDPNINFNNRYPMFFV